MLPLLLATTANAQSLRLVSENDVYLSTWDRYYSAGNLLMLELEPARLQPALERIGLADAQLAVGFANQIYTPKYIFKRDYGPDARDWLSWAGWSLSTWGHTDQGVATMGLTWGLTGPWSGGQWAQETIHRIPGLKTPVGWDGQMPTEPTVNLSLAHLWPSAFRTGGIEHSPYCVAQLGTWETGGTVGLLASWGSAPRQSRPLQVAQGRSARGPDPTQGWSMHAGLELHGWLRYLPLDGVLLQEGPSAPRRPGYGEAYLGIERRGPRWTVGYEMVGRTREAQAQDTMHRYGRVWVERGF